MLVVAAPDDSQPGTPAAEEKTNYDEAWADAAKHSGSKIESTTKALPLAIPTIATDSPESSSSSGQESTQESSIPNVTLAKESPLVAVPATVIDIDDDEDFSGWLDEDNLEDDPISEAPPVATVDEIK